MVLSFAVAVGVEELNVGVGDENVTVPANKKDICKELYLVQTNVVINLTICLLNPFPYKPWFLRVGSMYLLKTLWEKEKLLVPSNFSFSHSVFYPSGQLSAIFINFTNVVCKLFQFGRV